MLPNHIIPTTAKVREFLNRDLESGNEFREAIDLFLTLGIPKIDPEAEKRYVRFLLPAVKRFVWTWEALGCDPPGPTPAIAAIAQWLETGEYSKLLTDACIPCAPIRDGIAVQDCDEPALSALASATSRLAYFCHTRSIYDAAMVLNEVYWAAMENLQSDDSIAFEDWLVNHAPKLAWQ
jgi:hypothetical protein